MNTSKVNTWPNRNLTILLVVALIAPILLLLNAGGIKITVNVWVGK